MKQVQFDQYGSPDVLTLVEAPIPQPNPGEVVIKVQAIGVNYSDTQRRRNMYFQLTPLPFVPGTEAVGQVVAVGDGVNEPYLPGATVLAILPGGGGYAEYALAPAAYCIPLPPGIDANTATAIFVQGSTAQLLISQVAKDLKDKTVLINAAAGGVGSLLVQLAKMHGARVIAASSLDVKLTVAKSLGADETVNYSRPNWREQVNNGNGVDWVFETVGGSVYTESIKCLTKGGTLFIYGCASGEVGQVNPEYFVDENINQLGFNLAFHITTQPQRWQEALGTVIGLIAQGKLKIDITSRFALADAAEAHRQIEARQTTGKVVLNP
ncbi:quinone oxidoreductase family protein [Spirosoma spitsbergense]|uniref:quinone oxidoreductase family protein n=1 Tax=Spirosoma spitsbergense TaxID=431554 RepID=UPI00036A8AD5|nr:zinc-binding dehydrogenase [Spirosoma spitsbergense]